MVKGYDIGTLSARLKLVRISTEILVNREEIRVQDKKNLRVIIQIVKNMIGDIAMLGFPKGIWEGGVLDVALFIGNLESALYLLHSLGPECKGSMLSDSIDDLRKAIDTLRLLDFECDNE